MTTNGISKKLAIAIYCVDKIIAAPDNWTKVCVACIGCFAITVQAYLDRGPKNAN